ncbi:MAG: DUF3575 domain-containing protein [Bacteroidales bacterium]|nr:DUF3575 domain-containing protein [Bacteroidales bacterium]MBR6212559.1 DUF3575 domain-containing protein [Bacteroidales bacterium]
MNSFKNQSRIAGKAWGLFPAAVFVLFVLSGAPAGAQQHHREASDEFRITFPVSKYILDREYRYNARAFAHLDSLLAVRGQVFVDSVIVVSKSSPEGPFKGNEALSVNRSKAIYDYVVSAYPNLADKVRVSSEVESWGEFAQMVSEDPTLSSATRADALAIIGSELAPDAKKAQLRRLKEYNYFLKYYFPALRFSAIVVVFDRVAEAVASLPVLDDVTFDEFPWIDTRIELPEEHLVIPALTRSIEEIRPILAVSTNLVYDFGSLAYDMAFTPNIAVEVPIGQSWSVYAEYAFPWWLTPQNDRAWEILKWDIGGRWWFSRHNPSDRMDVLRGHFLGLDFGAGYYDIEPKHTGYQGEFQTLGLEYGYAFRLSPHWRLDLYAGAGWMGTHYRYYEGTSDDVHLIYQHHGRLQWFGPVKAGASIKYIFTRKVRRSAR